MPEAAYAFLLFSLYWIITVVLCLFILFAVTRIFNKIRNRKEKNDGNS